MNRPYINTTESRYRVKESTEVPQPVSPTIRVTRFSRIFSTIFSLSAITGREENFDDENGLEYDELHDEVGDEAIALLHTFSLSRKFFESTL